MWRVKPETFCVAHCKKELSGDSFCKLENIPDNEIYTHDSTGKKVAQVGDGGECYCMIEVEKIEEEKK
jgi:hypothetical protein